MVAALPSSALLSALSRAFAYPWDGIAETTRDLEALGAGARGSFGADIDAALAASRAFEDRTAEQLEYTRLFIGSFRMEAPPYASYWRDGAGEVDGKTAAEVRGIFAEFGIRLDPAEKAPADHLRYLLAFLAQLARRYEETGEEAFAQAYADFRDEYVLSWLGAFRERLDAYAEHDYYKLLVALIAAAMGAQTH